MDAPIRTVAGVLPVFQTPFHPDESIDFETLEREIAWALDRGADGIVMAMVSEVLRLSTEERRELAAAACRAARSRGVVVISVSAESSLLAERFARHAADVGADAVMAIPPISVALDEAELMRYYERILAASELPLVIQDASGYVGRPIPIELQARIQREFRQRVFFKLEAHPLGQRLSALRDATDGQARILDGSGGAALVDCHRRGIVGTMPAVDMIDGIVALWRALETADADRVNRLAPLITSLAGMHPTLDGMLAIEKYLLHKQGVFRNTLVRGPVGFRLDDETRAEVDRLFGLIMEVATGGGPAAVSAAAER